MKKPPNVLPERLRMLRARDRLSQEQVADRIGKSQNAIGTWERGESQPQANELAMLADLYGVSCDYLVGLVKHPHGLPSGSFLIDLDEIESPTPGEDWAIQIPTNAKVVSFEEFKALEKAMKGKKGGRK